MPVSTSFLFKNSFEYIAATDRKTVPTLVRGIYVLFKEVVKGKSYEVVYVGMARGEKSGAKSRLGSHSRHKAGEWTHFSVYEAWDNIPEALIKEIEGLLRHIYRHDPRVNVLNKQKRFKVLGGIRRKTMGDWLRSAPGTPSKPKVGAKVVAAKKQRRSVG